MTVETRSLHERLGDYDRLLEEACIESGVPGASLAVRQGDELMECAAGLLNHSTGVEATPDSLFQIGSITKVFTTTLIMQLVDEGRADLDTPVRHYLPELKLRERDRAESVTLRHLVTHTSGIDGDFFLDTGRGDDCVERYVLAMAAVPGLHPLGEMWSYCNAGFVLAGRVIEKLTGLSWDDALKQRILRPAGLSSMGTLPEEAILGRVAAGHMPGEDGKARVIPLWALPRSNGPAGSTPFAAARDLLTFGCVHLNGGVTSEGHRLLTQESVGAMQGRHAELPGLGQTKHWGLGWMHFDWAGEPVIGHDGGTIGQSAFLRIAPNRRLGVALLTNGGNTQALSLRVLGEVFQRLGGIEVPGIPEPPEEVDVDSSRFEGTYEKLSARIEIGRESGNLVATSTERGFFPLPSQVQDLRPLDETNVLGVGRGTGIKSVMTFLGPRSDGRFEYVRAGARLHRLVT